MPNSICLGLTVSGSEFSLSSSVIHLASYGKRGANGSDKTEIFVSEKSKNYAGSQTKPEELSSEFLKILTDMSVDGKLKNTNDFANVRVNNFPSIPTTSNLQKLYNNALNLA